MFVSMSFFYLFLAVVLCNWSASILAMSPLPLHTVSAAFMASKRASQGTESKLIKREDAVMVSISRKPKVRKSVEPKLNLGDVYDDNNNKDLSKQLTLDRRQAIRNLILSNAMAVAAVAPANANAISFSKNKKEVRPTTATDVAGNPIIAASFLSTHKSGDRTLVQGLKGDPTYLIVKNEDTTSKFDSDNKTKQPSLTFERYALNAECTHLGCIVPWDAMQSKFVCPCHGSQYTADGTLLRGPAPYSLKLAAVEVDVEIGVDRGNGEGTSKMGTGRVVLSQWDEDDFRTGEKPWWV